MNLFFLGQKILGQKEKILVTSIFSLPTMFSKGFFLSGEFNSLPNDKILDWSKFKAFADDKINGDKMMISLTG